MQHNKKDSSDEPNSHPTNNEKRTNKLSKIKTFRSLKYPSYRLYYGALFAHHAALNMHMVTRSYLVYELTGSSAILGIMSVAHAIPMIMTVLFGGAIADRIHKKHVIIAGQAFSAVASLGIAIALTSGYLSMANAGSWWILIAAAVLDGALTGIIMPSRHSIIPEIVGKESVMNAIGLNNLSMSALLFIGPAVAGFLVDAFNYQVVYFIMTALTIIEILLITFIPLTGRLAKTGSNMLANIKEGLGYLKNNRNVLFVLLFILFAILLSRPIFVLLPIFSEDILGVGIKGMGILTSVAGAGAILGSTIVASMPNKKRGLILLLACMMLGIAMVIFSTSTSWWLSLAIMFIIGLGQTTRMTLGNVLVQDYTEDRYRGRVMSVYTLEFGLTSFGAFIAGMLGEVINVQWVLSGFALVLMLLTISTFLFIPRMRKLD